LGSLKVVHLGTADKLMMGCISCIITLVLSLKVFEEIATVNAENGRLQQPGCRLTLPARGTAASISIYFIFLEPRIIDLHFCQWQYGSIFIHFYRAMLAQSAVMQQ